MGVAARNRDDFSPDIVRKLAMRAAYICTNPLCCVRTLGPAETDAEKAISVGIAAHITAAAPGGPRYDPALTSGQRRSIENGIFLCPACASMIDKNGGGDFPVELLQRWKSEHEAWARGTINKPAVSPAKSRAPVLEVCFDDGSTRFEVQKVRSVVKGKDDKAGLGDHVVRLDLLIANRGDGPASDVHVFLEFAGPYQVYTPAELHRCWDIYPHNFFDNPRIFLEQMTGKRMIPAVQRLAEKFVNDLSFGTFELGIAPYRKKPKNVTSHDAKPSTPGIRWHLSASCSG